MGAEEVALPIPIVFVVIIIEPALADADNPGMACALDQGLHFDIRMDVGLVRVNADRGPDIALALGDADDGIPLTGAGRDVEHRLDAGSAGTAENPGLVLDEALIIEDRKSIRLNSSH